jgi:F-box and WD-40 domain protein MET30
MCCFSQLSMLSEQLGTIIRIDPFSVLPGEIAIRILGYLDATSLCRAAQVSRRWKVLADDDTIWRGICEQHIGQKCAKCGWGLPVLDKKRLGRTGSSSATPTVSSLQHHHHQHHLHQQQSLGTNFKKRELELSDSSDPSSSQYQSGLRGAKRQRAGDMVNAIAGPGPSSSSFRSMKSSSSPSSVDAFASSGLSPPSMDEGEQSSSSSSSSLLISNMSEPPTCTTRPWKDVYSERLTVERNWRRGRYKVRTLKGHTDGVMCMQFSECLSHPSFPILITGSYDRTVRVWNMDTGQEVLVMRGHTRAVRALQFDEAKLITGSMDHTIKVWDWRKGRCIRTLEGHTEGVVCLNYDSNVLASGSVDTTIKVWNFRTGEAFTLRGHCDWVNSVQLWDSTSSAPISSTALVPPSSCSGRSSPMHPGTTGPNIDPGKMLFSASDDGTIRLWDLTTRACVRQYSGHVAQVQSMKLLFMDESCSDTAADEPPPPSSHPSFAAAVASQRVDHDANALVPHQPLTPSVPMSGLTLDDGQPSPPSSQSSSSSPSSRRTPVLISGSLDNTIKFWDINTGKVLRTLFGHIEGVWAVASDRLRLVSGSHDRTIKVWAHEDGKCTGTLVGHSTPVTCLSLGEDKIVSGSEDGDIRIWNFS